MKKVIIFDLDGTVLDSSKGIINSINYVRNYFGLPPISFEIAAKTINSLNSDIARNLYDVEKLSKIHTQLFEEHYKLECKRGLRAYEGIKDVLQELKKTYKLAVATNGFEKYANIMIKQANLDEFFDLVVASDMVNAKKPDPKMLFHILEKYNFLPSEAIFIGDSKKDEFASKNADIDYIYAAWGFSECNEEVLLCQKPIDLIKLIKNF